MKNMKRLSVFFMVLCMLVTSAVSPGGTLTVLAETAGTPETQERAEYLLDEDFSFLAHSNDPTNIIASGWDVRKAGGSISYSFNSWFKITDTSNLLPVSLNKKFVPQSSGAITLEYRFKMATIVNGVQWQLRGGKTGGVVLSVQNGSLGLETQGSRVELQTLAANTDYGVKVVADIDKRLTEIYVNGTLKSSSQSFKNPVGLLDNFFISTGDTTTGEVFFYPVKIHKGYVVNEKFISMMAGSPPSDWTVTPSGGIIAVEKMDNAKPPDVYSLRVNGASSTGDIRVEKSIPNQEGNLVFEYKAFFPNKENGFSAELTNDNAGVFKILSLGGKFCYVNTDGQPVEFYNYTSNLWYHFKLKLSTLTGKVDIYLNGKLAAKDIQVHASAVNHIKFTLDAGNKGNFALDDLLLYKDAPEPSDYVPAPVKVNTGDVLVGLQTCSMWREGQHLGWDRINQFPDRKPLLGFYDEGNPEEADWELKWMAEHGIGYEMFCWYKPNGSAGMPLKDPRMGVSLHEGYFSAKYSNLVDFMIMWENGGPNINGSADFRNNVIPYWMEYYFKDPRYLKVGNKPVIAIYSYSNFKSGFGGTVEGARAEIQYLKDACKNAGFDDAIVLFSYSGSDAAVMNEMKSAGIDAIFAYSWGTYAGKEAVQKSKLEIQRDAGGSDVIPVVSMGRDDSAWDGPAGYYATTEEFQSVAQWVKDTFIPSLPAESEGKKLVLLDNWNEYGEGHFIMPTQLNGFGYLDAIRKVFATGNGHTDEIPTQTQKERIGVLYPAGRVMPPKTVTAPPITDSYTKRWDFNTDGDSQGWTVVKQVSDVTVAGGYYLGTSTGGDPGIISPDSLGVSAEENPYIHIRMKNNSNDTSGKIYFITEADTNWNEAKGIGVFVNPNDSNYTDYYVPMWNNSNWAGKVKAIRFDPITTTGSFSIDFIGMIYSQSPGIALYLDGQRAKTVTSLETLGESIMVPMAEVLKKIGISTEWDEENALIAVKDGSVIRMVPGQPAAYKGETAVTLEQMPVISGNDLLVSSDALKKLFGYNIAWKADEQALYVTTQNTKILGDNILVDPGMEMSTLQYSGSRITTELSTSEYHSGHQSVKITKGYEYAKIFFPGVENGKEYYYSAWGKLDPGSTTGEKLRICLQYTVDGVNKQVVMIVGPAMDALTWKQTQGYFKLNETGNVTNLTMYIYTDSPAAADTYYLDDVEIRPVTYSTDPVLVHATGVSLNKTSTEIAPGKTQRLFATVEPNNAVERRVTWKSDNTEVAIVDVNGAVYAKKEGTASITATTVDGGKTATCAVTVREGAYETVTLTVKTDGTGDFLSPKLANDSIRDSSPEKQYIILIYPGVYTEKEWVVKPYTTLRGTDRELCWLKGENPESATNSEITNQSTVWLKSTANLENLTITAKNMRYPVHSEDSGNNKDAIHNIKNCYIEHYGNIEAVQYRKNWVAAHPGVTPPADLDPAQVWGGISGNGSHAWGYGSGSGVIENFYDSTFVSKADGWYVHNREDFSKPQINTINNSKIVSNVTSSPITIQSLGSGTKDQTIFNNCEIVGTYLLQNDTPWITQKPENQYANHADYTVTLNNSTPLGYMDGHRGRALAITSNSTGSNSYVRVSGDAVESLLGQYIAKDGGGSLKGYLYGYWDISGIKVGLNSSIDVINTLGRRLGDCTATNKTLNVSFENGVTKTIVFNENYTAQPNSYVLEKVNSVLGTLGVAAEYNVTANEYYPQVPDKQLTLNNNTSVGIPRFAAVCFDTDRSTLRLMKSTDLQSSFIGITLEAIAPGQSGRVLTEGIMHKSQLNGFTGNIAVGTKITNSASKNGVFEINANQPVLMEGVRTDWAYFKAPGAMVKVPVLEKVELVIDKFLLKQQDTAVLTVTGTMDDGSQAALEKAQIEFTSTNEQIAKVTPNGTVTAVGEGTAIVKVTVTMDEVTKVAEVQLTVDGTPATTVLTANGALKDGWYSSNVVLALNASDNISGVSKTEYKLGESDEWRVYSAPVELQQDGIIEVYYRSVDKVGNLEPEKHATVKIDKTAPVTSAQVAGTLKSDGTYDSYVTVSFSVQEAVYGSGITGTQYSLDGVQWLAYTAPFTFSENGVYNVLFKSEDYAGNAEVVRSVSIHISMNADTMALLLLNKVNTMDMEQGIKKSLVSKLDNTLQAIHKREKNNVVNELNAFLHEVDAQNGKKLTVEQSKDLSNSANKIIVVITTT